MEEDEHSPVPPRRAPPMNSPFVPSVARCASAEAEEKRQVAAASPDFVTAVLTSVTCGSARRGGLDWGG